MTNPTEQLPGREHTEKCDCGCCDGANIEQPNTNAMIIKTIQGLMTCVNDNLAKLYGKGNSPLVSKALEEIDLFERTTLYKLQQEFE